MSSFTELAMKPDWCGCSLNKGLQTVTKGTINYVSKPLTRS